MAIDQDRRVESVDASPESRPGVPMEAPPEPDPGAHWEQPAQQQPTVEILHRPALDGPTLVFGTAQPPRWISGALRRFAYRIPDHRARHWLMLLVADRVDTAEHRVAGLVTLDGAEYRALLRDVRTQPVRWALIGVGTALLVRRIGR